MIYKDAVGLLQSQGKFKINLGLDRMYAILKLLGNPQDKLKCIHVAGTNGKGSVCTMLASVLQEAGYKIGLYTSPHIFEYTERIKINDVKIPHKIFAQNVEKIVKLAEENGIDLTEFEILTAVMFVYFAHEQIDYVVLETGLGGRLDATNVIKSNLCAIITHIDLDHTERLGNTKSEIAKEKAGIIKPNCPVITSEGYEIIKDIADKNNSLFIFCAPVETNFEVALKGTYQKENLSLVLTAIRYLFPQISDNIIQEGLKKVKHPFRFQFFPELNLIIDGAHNPNGAKALRESLDEYDKNQKRRFVFGCLKNKDYPQMLKTLIKEGDEVYFYEFPHQNSTSYEELSIVCPVNAQKFTTMDCINPDCLNIICGSLYMISHLVEQLRRRKPQLFR